MKILIIDDNQTRLQTYSQDFGDLFEIEVCSDPAKLLAGPQSIYPHLILLEVFLMNSSGLEILVQLKKSFSDVPIILTSEMTIDRNIIDGLNLGAQDYIVRPVSTEVFVARLKNKVQEDSECINIDNFSLYPEKQLAVLEDKKIQLTPIETRLLIALAKHPDTIFTRENIQKAIWPDIHVQNQNIDTHISNLRKKLFPFSEKIKTVKHKGYFLAS